MPAAFDSLSGQEFGFYKVICFHHMQHNGKDGRHAMSYYVCECKICGARKVVARSNLIQSPYTRHCHPDRSGRRKEI